MSASVLNSVAAPPVDDLSAARQAAAAWADDRSRACIDHALILQRTDRQSFTTAHAQDPLLTSALAALAAVQLDDAARALGFRSEHITEIRSALAALLDEAAGNQPGGDGWRTQLFARAGLAASANVGHEFFVTLEHRLSSPQPTPAELAVLQVYTACLLLGFRGRYGAHVDAHESELQRHIQHLRLRLRPVLHRRPAPAATIVPIQHPRPLRWTSLWLAVALMLFCGTLLVSLRASLAVHADALRHHLAEILTDLPAVAAQ